MWRFIACVMANRYAHWIVVVLATHLMSNALQVRQSEVWLVTIFPVVLLKFIQVCSQQLAHKEQVLLQAAYVFLHCSIPAFLFFLLSTLQLQEALGNEQIALHLQQIS